MRIEALNVLPGDQLPGTYTAKIKDAFLRNGEIVIELEYGEKLAPIDKNMKVEVVRDGTEEAICTET